ncbi:hypothetical protein [Hymenobacter volaticus]|uniref:Uncharacterized protein n=1 Tax=Hymenobacter volaticus TaxID=2932254 RepID=A0ABY4G298_9BACT|nr:hypothetical protein [Hymenobacter volaticus]UOQ64901.1 hypothetical protein MUN86_15180 [Hymenobacter volaticus]
MKKMYTSQGLRSYLKQVRPLCSVLGNRLWAPLILSLAISMNGIAQNFTETFGTAAAGIQTFESLTSADANSRLNNSAPFTFSGNALGSPANARSTGYSYTSGSGTTVNASGGASVVFARENPNNPGTAQVQPAVTYTLTIANINTTGLNSRQRITFGLRVPVDGVEGDIVLEARDGNTAGAFVAIPFAFPTAPEPDENPSGTW